MRTKLKKGDKVIIIAGKDKKNKGSSGEGVITYIDRKKERVTIEGLNKGTKHIKPSANNAGGRVEKEMPIHISNVMYSYEGKPARLGFNIKEDGKKVRVAIVGGKRIEIK
ncbi:50S ribosomal protein L24 [Epulopiscium sp. SCG-B10WGA-EpuloA2]|nr:50S ribosomal protein L24 [Epulopiscium sp. SCG-B10WGA-EpuloA2]ONI45356.1 50S ribosomal protein L24 [Epulopiscium sp. SCG-C07WGA-EpuloA2]